MEPKRLSDVSIGDCLYFDYDYQAKTTAIFTVECSTPHEGEVMAAYQHPDAAFPGQQRLREVAGPAFGNARDALREAGQLPTATGQDLTPTEADWKDGVRTSVTMLHADASTGLLDRGYFDPSQVEITRVVEEPLD